MLYEAAPNISSELIPISSETPSFVIPVLPASQNHRTFPRLNRSENNGMILADAPLRLSDAEKRMRFRGCPTLRMLNTNEPGVSINCPSKKLFPTVGEPVLDNDSIPNELLETLPRAPQLSY